MARIPNLFRTEKNPERCQWHYERLLSRLYVAGRASRMIVVCRQIRRFAAASRVKDAGMFTYRWEMDACGHFEDFDSMWRILRAWEQVARKKRLDLAKHRWRSDDFHLLIFFYAPLLYLRRRYRLGCRLLETALGMIAHRQGWSFEMFWHVYKPLAKPARIHDVTLSHFYSALGQSLVEWPLWNKFVDDLHPKLLRMSGVSRTDLKKTPALMKPLYRWITNERNRRLFSGATHGVRDLTDPPAKVGKRQAATIKKILKLDEKREEMERALEAMFPELANLPPRPGLKELLEARGRTRR